MTKRTETSAEPTMDEALTLRDRILLLRALATACDHIIERLATSSTVVDARRVIDSLRESSLAESLALGDIFAAKLAPA